MTGNLGFKFLFNTTGQWEGIFNTNSISSKFSKKKHQPISLNPASSFSAKRNFPFNKNYSDISKIWNVKNQDFPFRQLGNCRVFFSPDSPYLPRSLKRFFFFFLFLMLKKCFLPLCLFVFLSLFCLDFSYARKWRLKNEKLHLPNEASKWNM